MAQTLTQRLNLIKNTPGTGEQVNVAEINSNSDAIDDWKIPAAKLINNTAAQSVATGSSAVAVDYSAVAYDTWAAESEGPMADITGNEINIKINGMYMVCASVFYLSNATGSRILNVLKNSVIAKRNTEKAHDTAHNELSITFPIPLQAGDSLSCSTSQTSGGALDLVIGATSGDPEGISLSATWVGKHP